MKGNSAAKDRRGKNKEDESESERKETDPADWSERKRKEEYNKIKGTKNQYRE